MNPRPVQRQRPAHHTAAGEASGARADDVEGFHLDVLSVVVRAQLDRAVL
jgi:hypothetical protein